MHCGGLIGKNSLKSNYDAIVIGSGFGGSMAAYQLVNAGKSVLMLERGDWVARGPENWSAQGSVDLTPFYSKEVPYQVLAGGNNDVMGAYTCVGGPSVFYGTVSMRFREADFQPAPEIVGTSNARWPIRYEELESFYTLAEDIIGVSGETGQDPTEPRRTGPYNLRLGPLSETSKKIGAAAERLGLRPFRLPLAINYQKRNGRAPCENCTTCDTFACAIGAKNDLATRVLPGLLDSGLDLRTNAIAVDMSEENGRIAKVTFIDKITSEAHPVTGRAVVLAAGALASPHLLLSSGLEKSNPGGDVVGRYLTRHCNAIAFGFFLKKPDPKGEFHKQLGIHDFYFGHPTIAQPTGKLGSMQQLQTPPVALVHNMVPAPFGKVIGLGVPHLTGLLVMAEDQPQYDNRVEIDPARTGRYGLPQLLVTHHYTRRDYDARSALLRKASAILREAGALFCYEHKIKTFSHAVGTIRMGEDPEQSALDHHCNFRGIDNLFVTDGSFMPTSGGLNPSLTIAANALRVGRYLCEIC